MRIERIHLAPFGTFEDKPLDFSHDGAGAGMHLVFGANGAGKSTTLRALRAALFGIERGEGSHRFGSATLRIGATLSRANGDSTIAFQRRTSTKSPIWDETDASELPIEMLSPFLGGLDRRRFETLFGLDIATMTSGGKQLLDGKGDIGQALFGARLGGKDLARVTDRLAGDARELWAPRARKTKIHALVTEHRDLTKERRAAELKYTRYDSQRRELAKLREEDAKDDATLRTHREQADAATRLVRAHALLAPLNEKARAIQALGDVEPLDTATSHAARDTFRELERIERDQASRQKRIHDDETLRLEISARIQTELLEAANDVAELAARREAYREALAERDDHIAVRAKAVAARDEALGRSGLDASAASKPEPDADEAARFEDLTVALDHHHAERERLLHLRSGAALEVERARLALQRAESTRDELKGELRTQFALELEELRPFDGDLEALASVELPTRDAIRSILERTETQERSEQRQHDAVESAEAAARAAKAEQARIQAHPLGAPPTRDEVSTARSSRDTLVSSLLARAVRGELVTPEESIECERATAAADRLADELATQSARASERVANEEALSDASLRCDEAARAGEAIEAERRSLDGAWASMVAASPIQDLDAEQALGWLQRRRELLQRVEDQRRAAVQAVKDASAEHGARVAALTDTGRQITEANGAWLAWAEAHSLDVEAGPEAARTQLRIHVDARRLAREADRSEESLRKRLAIIESFEAEARALASRCSIHAYEGEPTESGDAPLALAEARLEALIEAVDDAKNAASERRALDGRLTKERGASELATNRCAELERTLDQLAERAGLPSRSELAAREAISDNLRQLRNDQRQLMAAFDAAANGRTVDEIREEIGDRTALELEAEASRLGTAAEELESGRRERSERIGELRPEVEGAGSARSAEIASQLAGIEAELADLTEEYMQTRLAQKLLDREVDHYRQKTQGPLLKRAQALFETLTLGAYVKLHPSEAGGKQVMVARRPDGQTVDTDGMSTGTVDQLYLALRIASVEHMLRDQEMEPMPFIADDLFVNFDDERTEAALRVLAELSASTQVIVFSHHERVVETAEALTKDGVAVHVVRLDSEALRESQAS